MSNPAELKQPSIKDTYGDLEKLLWLGVAGVFGVNSIESEGEQTGIIREQFRGGRRAVLIFRGPLTTISSSALAPPAA